MKVQADTSTCPECGAPRVDGLTCWEQLGMLIAWEGDDPELLAEHFLTVATYNLQHPAQFTDEALEWLRAGFIAHLAGDLAVAELRRRAARQFEGPKRVLKPVSERQLVRRAWTRTIAAPCRPGAAAGQNISCSTTWQMGVDVALAFGKHNHGISTM